MFHWNREASVEGSHIFLHANMNTHIPADKNGSYLMFCFAKSCYIAVRSNFLLVKY